MTETPRPDDDSFALANRAFEMFTLDERRAALKVFASLQYESVEDRLMEAVHRVITRPKRMPADV